MEQNEIVLKKFFISSREMSIFSQEMEKLSKEMAISLLEINFLIRLIQVL